MSVYELLKLHETLLRVMADHGVDVDLVRAVSAYEEYRRLTAQGLKKEYVYAMVGEHHGLSRTTIFRMARRMEAEISLPGT